MISVSGQFATTSTPGQIISRSQEPTQLATIDSLTEVRTDGPGRLRAVLTTRTPLGRIPLQTTITTVALDEQSGRVDVRATRGPHSVDVELDIRFDTAGDTTQVTWSATARLGGTAASVGQRVAPAIAKTTIDEILRQLAAG